MSDRHIIHVGSNVPPGTIIEIGGQCWRTITGSVDYVRRLTVAGQEISIPAGMIVEPELREEMAEYAAAERVEE